MSRLIGLAKQEAMQLWQAVSRLRQVCPVLLAAFVSFSAAASATDVTTRTLNADGGWCWFQDERALMDGSNLVFASISSSGTVTVTSYDTASSGSTVVPIKSNFVQPGGLPDDHNVAALLHRNDGRFLAFYAKHHAENRMYVRQTKQPDNALEWNAETFYSFNITDKTTYANPFQLSNENGRIYLFWRGLNFWPTFSYSDDGGSSWSTAANIVADAKGNTSTRPYAKYCSNNRDTIHMMYTDAHPRNLATNSVYHIYYRGGNVYKSDGTLLRKLGSQPVLTTEGTKVYDGAGTAGRGWGWDICLDEVGNPVMVYATVPTLSDHRYRYGHWNSAAKRWFDQEIAYAGSGLYAGESQYSGGICVDPDDTSIVYLSANVDPSTGVTTGTGHREIYQGKTPDGGLTWNWKPVTQNSVQDNIRPIVPAHHPTGTFVLWMQGTYNSFNDYHTQIVLATDTKVSRVTEWRQQN